METILYSRHDGVLCYAAPLFDGDRIVTVVASLFATDLIWHWMSLRRHETVSSQIGASRPDTRPLTRLHRENERAFIEDIKERDVDGYGRAIIVLATDSGGDLPFQSAAELERTLGAFARSGSGPLRLVISQVGDSPVEHVFVPRDPIPVVGQLLMELGLDEPGVQRVQPYGALRLASLEAITESIVRYALQ